MRAKQFTDMRRIHHGNHPFSADTTFSEKLTFLKDTHKEKAPSNKTPTLTKSINIEIWMFVTSNQLFIRGS